MYTTSSFYKKTAAVLLAVMPGLLVHAQDAAAAPEAAPVAESSNLLATLLLVTAVVLAFITWAMGQALVAVSRLALEKQKSFQKAAMIALVLLFSSLSQSSFAQEAAAAAAPNYGGLSQNTFYAFVLVIGIEVLAIFYLAFMISKVYGDLRPRKDAAEKSALGAWWANLDKKFFTKATPVEKEADVLLDHDYDGIKELDNALPSWWKYGFYITIAVAVFYIISFHITGSGKNPYQEYAAEMDKAKVEKEAYEANNKDKVDEKNIPMADAAGLAKGKEIFESKCWPCHGKLGEGGAGPNLTDDYWIHKGSLNDIFASIKTGYPDKGMQSWAKEFTPKQMSFLASYIKTLRGTNPPGGKAAQGDLFTEAGTTNQPAAGTDTTKAAAPVADSAAVKPAAPAAATPAK